ncbi:unnamed protein product [Urochloa decumbens]|uniref:Glycosyltransferase n=1 Tax=Urochloa decumbens TaxID=240449 RepID=A0ABC9AKS4_9POAL
MKQWPLLSQDANAIYPLVLLAEVVHCSLAIMEVTSNATTPPLTRPVVLYPTPGMGHLFAMVELGRALAARGLNITVVILDPPYDTGAPAPFLAAVSAANPSIYFHRLPPPAADDLPPVASKHYEALIIAAVRASIPHLRRLLAAPSMLTPAALVVDMFSGAALDVSMELGVPSYFFFTSGAACLAFFLHLPALHAQSAASFRDMGDELIQVPGIPPFPATHAVHATMDRGDVAYGGFMDAAAGLGRCHGVIINTFRWLEARALDAIADGRCGTPAPLVHCVGPLIKSLEFAEGDVGAGCLAWLDEQPEASVVFLCFGSLGRFSADQTREIAVGLEASGHRFLWVVRAPPLGDGSSAEKRFQKKLSEPDLDVLLPDGFLARTIHMGLAVKSWAPQRDVLAHRSVGGFVTHCGWNSVLEAVTAGVPMLGLPLHAEQRMNVVVLEKELRLAVALEGYDREEGVVAAAEVASKVRWLMDSDGGKELRERTAMAMLKAKEAVHQGGESEVALAGLVDSWMSCRSIFYIQIGKQTVREDKFVPAVELRSK